MKRKCLLPILALLLFLLAVSAAQAQTAAQAARQIREADSQGYLFVAPGGVHNGGGALHVGGGLEDIFKNGVSIGLEVGYLAPTESLKNGLAVFSANGGYHFLSASRSGKAAPFLTAGYAGFIRSGYAHGVNYSGGVNYWVRERLGIRIEFRDHVFIKSGSTHFLNARVGLVFR